MTESECSVCGRWGPVTIWGTIEYEGRKVGCDEPLCGDCLRNELALEEERMEK